MSWTKLLRDEDDASVKILDEKTNCLCEQYFLTSDAKRTKYYEKSAASGNKFWKKCETVKSAIINPDNHVVKRTIASMPSGIIPSGHDWNLFLTRLIYNLYREKRR